MYSYIKQCLILCKQWISLQKVPNNECRVQRKTRIILNYNLWGFENWNFGGNPTSKRFNTFWTLGLRTWPNDYQKKSKIGQRIQLLLDILWGHILGCPTIFPPPSTTRFNCLQCTVQVESICFVECLYDQWKSFAVNYKFVPPFQIQLLGVQYVNKLKFKLPPSDNSLKYFMKNHLCNLKLFFMPCSKCRRLVVLLCMNFISCIIILYENPQNRL